MEEEIIEYMPETVPEFEMKEEDIPWLTSDKLDASVSIRWITWVKMYTWYITTSWNITVNVWFKPRYVFLQSIFSSTQDDISRSWTVEDNGELITTTSYTIWSSKYTLGSWSSTTINAVQVNTTQEMKISDFNSTWFTLTRTLWSTSLWIHIFVIYKDRFN